MLDRSDLIWQSATDRIVLSPSAGGRIISWIADDVERVMHPIGLEGGILRVLFAEEQYPGTSYVSPHLVLARASDPHGFRIHLRHFWNAPNAFLRLAGWPDKANLLHLDGLLLDKIVTFHASARHLTCELTITNLQNETKFFTPWLHNSFSIFPGQMFVTFDGERVRYHDTDIYWGSHVVEPGKIMRMVHGDAEGKSFFVTGGPSDAMAGMCGYLPILGDFLQSTAELRFRTVTLRPTERWRATTSLVLTNSWKAWTNKPELTAEIKPASDVAWNEQDLLPLLDDWALPEETHRGFMVLSYLDKPPFSSAKRYAAGNQFAGFHKHGENAVSHVVLYPLVEGLQLRTELRGSKKWSLHGSSHHGPDHHHSRQHFISGNNPLTVPHFSTDEENTISLVRGQLIQLELRGPINLAHQHKINVMLSDGRGNDLTLSIADDASVEPAQPHAVKMLHTYLEERWQQRTTRINTLNVEQFLSWQRTLRARHWKWMEDNTTGRCEPQMRLVERQEGPTCYREKWLVQTEPDLWMPGYLVRPKGSAPSKMSVLFWLHGSGPGKQMFAGDEDPSIPRTQLSNELEFQPYLLADALRCLVWVPDCRGCGEQGETNPSVYSRRLEALGLSYTALRMIDLPRTLDALARRHDVDMSRIGSLGCSGGGWSSLYFAAVDERVSAAIVSSTSICLPSDPPEGYFKHMFASATTKLQPNATLPCSSAHTGALVAPRPMWIMDGRNDSGISPENRPAWWAQSQIARDEIRHGYRLLGADDRYEDTWFDGGHCAGITTANVIAYFKKWFQLS